MKLSAVSAVNDDKVLQSCFLRSPEAAKFDEILLQRGFHSATTAYNEAIAKARNDIVVLLHQDVYLPPGWLTQITVALERLNLNHPEWAVAGLYGATAEGENRGYLYCVANGGPLGAPLIDPVEVVTLDEVVLLVRKSSGLRFDSALDGFHFYGADLCLAAQAHHLKCYVIPGFFIHNANEYGMFPRSFWEGYLFMRKKWNARLPLKTPCIDIQRSLVPPLIYLLRRYLWLKKARRPLARRVADPALLYTHMRSAEGGLAS